MNNALGSVHLIASPAKMGLVQCIGNTQLSNMTTASPLDSKAQATSN